MLSAAGRTVDDLCCRVADADADAQKLEVGQALQALIAAADGATMTERVANAVDIREWVEVHYLLTRPASPQVAGPSAPACPVESDDWSYSRPCSPQSPPATTA